MSPSDESVLVAAENCIAPCQLTPVLQGVRSTVWRALSSSPAPEGLCADEPQQAQARVEDGSLAPAAGAPRREPLCPRSNPALVFFGGCVNPVAVAVVVSARSVASARKGQGHQYRRSVGSVLAHLRQRFSPCPLINGVRILTYLAFFGHIPALILRLFAI